MWGGGYTNKFWHGRKKGDLLLLSYDKGKTKPRIWPLTVIPKGQEGLQEGSDVFRGSLRRAWLVMWSDQQCPEPLSHSLWPCAPGNAPVSLQLNMPSPLECGASIQALPDDANRRCFLPFDIPLLITCYVPRSTEYSEFKAFLDEEQFVCYKCIFLLGLTLQNATNWGFQTTDICCLTVLETTSLRSGCQQSCFMFFVFFFFSAVFSLCSHMASPPHACSPSICLCIQISSSCKDTCLVFNLTVTLKVLSLNIVTFWNLGIRGFNVRIWLIIAIVVV